MSPFDHPFVYKGRDYKPAKSGSGHGVSPQHGYYRASIQRSRVKYNLGLWDTEEEAKAAVEAFLKDGTILYEHRRNRKRKNGNRDETVQAPRFNCDYAELRRCLVDPRRTKTRSTRR